MCRLLEDPKSPAQRVYPEDIHKLKPQASRNVVANSTQGSAQYSSRLTRTNLLTNSPKPSE